MRREWCELVLVVGVLLSPVTAAFGGQPAIVPPMNFYFDRQPLTLPPSVFDSGSGRREEGCKNSYSSFERVPDACRTNSSLIERTLQEQRCRDIYRDRKSRRSCMPGW